MKKLGLFILALLVVASGVGSQARADTSTVVADEVIALQQGQVWNPECGITDSGLCGYDWGTTHGAFLGEAVVGYSSTLGGVMGNTLGFGSQERWGMGALEIIALPQSHAPLSHLLVEWVVYGTDLHGRPWKAEALSIDGEQITLHIVVYESVLRVFDPEYYEAFGVGHWTWSVELPENVFWNRPGLPGTLQIGEFSWEFGFEPTILVGRMIVSRVRNRFTPTPWRIEFQDRVLFVGTTLGPEYWAFQIYLPLAFN